MSLTITELQEKLMKIDEVSLLEVLDISSEDIVNRFVDKIDERYDFLVADFEEDNLNTGDFTHEYDDDPEACCVYSHCDLCESSCDAAEELDDDGR